jgi:hypothetical protein
LHKTGKLNRKLTSHGMRAFYVLARRSQGATDEQIAWEIGHSSNGACVKTTYGGVPENWRNGGGPNLSWLPAVAKPAWETIPPPKEIPTPKNKGVDGSQTESFAHSAFQGRMRNGHALRQTKRKPLPRISKEIVKC